MEEFLSGGPVEAPVAEAVADAVASTVSSKPGWCSVCKCFISQKKPHSQAECDANILKRKNRAPSSKKRIRLTGKRIKKLDALIAKAAWCDQVSGKIARLIKGSKKKINTSSLKKAVAISTKGNSKKIKSFYRSLGL